MLARPINAKPQQPYVHTQSVASSTWTINHNLGRLVQVQTFNATGEEFMGGVQQTSINTVVVSMTNPQAGTAVVA